MAAESGFIPGLVSVVTPAYNSAGFLARLLDSVLAQTWDAIEMILVDDGSQDGTLAVAESYRERFAARGYRYRVVAAAHKNASAAINQGLPLVQGEFLIWPDSDDTLTPDSVELRARFLQDHPQCQCVRSLMHYLDEAGEPLPAWEAVGDLQDEWLFFPVVEGKTFICCGCYMLRSAAFFQIYPGRAIPECDEGQNFQMLLPLLYRSPCPLLPQALYTVYVRRESHSRQKRTWRQEWQRWNSLYGVVEGLIPLYGVQTRRECRALCQRLRRHKWRQRYMLARQYRRDGWAALCMVLVFCYRGVSLREVYWAVRRYLGRLLRGQAEE